MPSSLATTFTLLIVVILLVWDTRRTRGVSSAIWIPVVWIAITGSRFPSQWLELGGGASAASTETRLVGLARVGAAPTVRRVARNLDARARAIVEAERASAKPLAAAQGCRASVSAFAAIGVVRPERDAVRAAAMKTEGAAGRIRLLGCVASGTTGARNRRAALVRCSPTHARAAARPGLTFIARYRLGARDGARPSEREGDEHGTSRREKAAR